MLMTGIGMAAGYIFFARAKAELHCHRAHLNFRP
jgi:hypothetical protein